jgi:hypothetical protein
MRAILTLVAILLAIDVLRPLLAEAQKPAAPSERHAVAFSVPPEGTSGMVWRMWSDGRIERGYMNREAGGIKQWMPIETP